METSIISIPKLPDDLIIEILARIPVKPLVKFRCLSKSWLSLLSTKQFIKTHLKNSKKCPDLATHKIILGCHDNLMQFSAHSLFHEPITNAFDTDYPFNFPRKQFSVVGSCDGLICIAVDRVNLILWNPSTRICKKLPDFDLKLNVTSSYFAIGFGFDKLSDDYKVVLGFFSGERGKSEVIFQVYSLKNGEWKRVKNFVGPQLMDDPGTFLNGKLHWITNHDSDDELGSIVSLDLGTEEFEVLEMPSYVKSGVYSRLGESRGFLSLFCSHLTSADLWVRNDCKGSWSKVVVIPYIDDFLKYSYKSVLCVLKSGEVLLLCTLTLVIFDPKDCSFRYPRVDNLGDFSALGVYLESLVSPVGGF